MSPKVAVQATSTTLSIYRFIYLFMYLCMYLFVYLPTGSICSIYGMYPIYIIHLHYLSTLSNYTTYRPTYMRYLFTLPTYLKLPTYTTYPPTYLSIHPSIDPSILSSIQSPGIYVHIYFLQSLQESREMNNHNCCQVWCKSCSSDLRFWRCILCLTQKRHWVILGLNHRTDTGSAQHDSGMGIEIGTNIMLKNNSTTSVKWLILWNILLGHYV